MDRSPRFGSRARDYNALLGLAFTTATPHRLTSPRTTNSQAHSSKGTPSPKKILSSDGLYATGFRYYFTPLPGYFSPFPHGTGPLSVTKEYLGLTGGPAGFTRNFRGPALLGTCPRKTMSYVYGTVTHSGTASQPLPLQHRFVTPRPPDSSGKNTPTTPHVQRLPAVHTRTVWPPPLSLATTHGITVVFFSCGY